jgi:HPt (histidine-containing phosphotransfer) domain-containing protein
MRARIEVLAEKFLQRTAEQLVSMRELLGQVAAGDPTAVRSIQELAHKIHGSGAMFGFPLLSDCGSDLERRTLEMPAEPGSADQLRLLLDRLAAALEATRRQGRAP